MRPASLGYGVAVDPSQSFLPGQQVLQQQIANQQQLQQASTAQQQLPKQLPQSQVPQPQVVSGQKPQGPTPQQLPPQQPLNQQALPQYPQQPQGNQAQSPTYQQVPNGYISPQQQALYEQQGFQPQSYADQIWDYGKQVQPQPQQPALLQPQQPSVVQPTASRVAPVQQPQPQVHQPVQGQVGMPQPVQVQQPQVQPQRPAVSQPQRQPVQSQGSQSQLPKQQPQLVPKPDARPQLGPVPQRGHIERPHSSISESSVHSVGRKPGPDSYKPAFEAQVPAGRDEPSHRGPVDTGDSGGGGREASTEQGAGAQMSGHQTALINQQNTGGARPSQPAVVNPARGEAAPNTMPQQGNTRGGSQHQGAEDTASGVPTRQGPASPRYQATQDSGEDKNGRPTYHINYSDGGAVTGTGKYQEGNTEANSNAQGSGYNRNTGTGGGGYTGGGRGYGYGYGSRYGNPDYSQYYDASAGQGIWNTGGGPDYDYYNLEPGTLASV